MADEPINTVDHIVSSYQKMAAWMNGVASSAFEMTERVLMVGAVKYAAAALPASSPSKITVTNIAGILQAILVLWLVTKLWAQSSEDYRTFHAAPFMDKKWKVYLFRIIGLLVIGVFTWWMNRTVHDLVEQTIGAFATPEGH